MQITYMQGSAYSCTCDYKGQARGRSLVVEGRWERAHKGRAMGREALEKVKSALQGTCPNLPYRAHALAHAGHMPSRMQSLDEHLMMCATHLLQSKYKCIKCIYSGPSLPRSLPSCPVPPLPWSLPTRPIPRRRLSP